MTLNEEQKKRRHDRILRWQQEQAEADKGRTPASSSAASSAYPASGKGVKAGKVKQEQAEADKGRAPASSSAASSAYPASGKGAKAGKVKRSWEVMQGAKSKGIKKGGSTDQGQASWRWTW